MPLYSWIKLLHVLSATVLLGTGLGIGFFLARAHRSGNEEAIRVTTASVLLADWLLTFPSVFLQFATGLWLTWKLGVPFGSLWFVMVIALFLVVGACWTPVVRIQLPDKAR